MQHHSARKFTLAYVSLAGLWIITSTLLSLPMGISSLSSVLYELFKGLAFVAVTGVLIYFYSRHQIQKELESDKALIRSEQNFRDLFESFGAMVLLLDPDTGTLVDINHAARDFYCYDRDELDSMSLSALFVCETPTIPYSKEHWQLRGRHRLKSGQEREVELFGSSLVLNGEKRILCIVSDVTEREKARAKFDLESERFGMAISALQGAVWEWDGESDDVALSPRHYEILGEPLGAFPPRMSSLIARVHEEDRPMVLAQQARLLSGKTNSFDVTFRARHAGGDWLWVRSRGRRSHGGNGKRQRIIGIDQELTERKLLEHQAEISHILLQKSPAVLFRWSTAKGWPVNFVTQNVELLGYAPEDFLEEKRSYASIIHPGDLPLVEERWDEYMQDRRDDFNLDYRILSKSGSIIWVSENTNLIRDNYGRVIELQGTIIDITARRLREIGFELAAHLDQAVLRDEPLKKIFSSFCDETARLMDFAVVWIGIKEPDGSVSYHTLQGSRADYLDGVAVRWDDTPEGGGPAGMAIRTGEIQHHLVSAPSFAPWRERAESFGLLETAAVPLSAGDETIGALVVYSTYPDGVSALHRRILRDVGRNVAIAWKNAERYQRILRQDVALSTTANGVVITDHEGRVEWVNPAFEKITGFALKDVAGKNLRFLKSGKHSSQFYKSLWDKLHSGETFTADFVNRRKDGTLYRSHQTITPLQDNSGKIVSFVAIQENIVGD